MSLSKYRYKTSRLYPKNSFLIGLGSIFNVFGNYFNFKYSRTEQGADRKAIENDWNMVGQDLRDAMYTQKLEFRNSKRKQVH